jgi:hypothetical protein
LTAYRGYAAGESVFSVGLFDGFSGKNQIMPVARFGKIALMPHPTEKIKAEIGPSNYVPIVAYLIEMVTWEGQSGSPVFFYINEGIRYEPMWTRKEGIPKLERHEPTLIGLVQGYYDIKQEQINSGIAIVVPAQDIIDTLMHPDLVHERERARDTPSVSRFTARS